ncbi:MAG: SGNH/GDSL hydrolase family protein [Chloracidobacterium sp.]|nr:SGNH/GDSL hydrolase family protein [Chloracidobacterium sp.]
MNKEPMIQDESKFSIEKKPIVKFKWGSVVFIAMVIATMALIEGATRLHQWYKHGDLPNQKPMHLVDFFRFYKVNPGYRSDHIRINSAGFRSDEEIIQEKPKDMIRIVLVGGSTVWGDDAHYPMTGIIDNRQTIASHLERILRTRAEQLQVNVPIQVINAGVIGYRLFQDEAYYNYDIANYKPDLVIAIDGHNDLDSLQLGVDSYRHKQDESFYRAMNNPGFGDFFSQAVKFGETHSMFLRKSMSKLRESTNKAGLESPTYQQKFEQKPSDLRMRKWLDDYVMTVRRFDASVRLAGGRILFAVQSEALGESMKPFTQEEKDIREHWKYYKWLHTEGRSRLVARMKEVSQQNNIWFLDISDTFSGEKGQVYLDYTHLTDLGNKLVAERLAKSIDSEVFHPKPSESD